jgi:beta-phosphoglucomutase-like phosphatase (HAD superfamily)
MSVPEAIAKGFETVPKTTNSIILLDPYTFYTFDILEKARTCTQPTVFFFKEVIGYAADTTDIKQQYAYIKYDASTAMVQDVIAHQRISDNAMTGAIFFANSYELYKLCKNAIVSIEDLIRTMITSRHNVIASEVKGEQVFFLSSPKHIKSYVDKTVVLFFNIQSIATIDDINYQAWYEALQPYHMILTNKTYDISIKNRNDQKVVEYLLPNNPKVADAIVQKKNEVFYKLIDKVTSIPGASDFMRYAKSRGHHICVMSSIGRPVTKAVLGILKASKSVDHIITTGPTAYESGLKLFNITSKKAYIFESSIEGVRSAKSIAPACIISVGMGDAAVNSGVTANINMFNGFNMANLFKEHTRKMNHTYTKSLIETSMKPLYDIFDIVILEKRTGCLYDIYKVDILLRDKTILNTVIKLEPRINTCWHTKAKAHALYEREYYFYEKIVTYLDIIAPTFYGIVYDEGFRTRGIVLEDMRTRGMTPISYPISLATCLKVIDQLIRIHVKFWNKQPFKKGLDNATATKDITTFIKTTWGEFAMKWSALLTNEQKALGESIVGNIDYIADFLSLKPMTLCHGGIRHGSVLFDCLGICFADWFNVHHGKGVADVVMLMLGHMDLETCLKWSMLIQHYYYYRLQEMGMEYDYAVYIRDFRLSLCFLPFFWALWTGTLPRDMLKDPNQPFAYIQKLFGFLVHQLPMGFFTTSAQ